MNKPKITLLDPKLLKPYPLNAKKHPPEQIEKLIRSINLTGFDQPIVVNKENDEYVVIKGHGRLLASLQMALKEVPCIVLEVPKLVADQARLMDNKSAESEYDLELLVKELSKFNEDEIIDTGFNTDDLDKLLSELESLTHFEEENGHFDEANQDEIPNDSEVETRVKTGDIWQLGNHLLLCGDCTIESNIRELVGDRKVTLVHADPPYGMGKEKDGVINDNLYREKLDEFQMKWWRSIRPFVNNNASAYIWGNAEDLWRLWYQGGLKNSERLTFRNQIIWDKKHGQGMSSEDFRMYPTVTEHCLFFMIGEQSFNNNADNYWDGWDITANYLREQKDRANFTASKIHAILESANNGGGLASHYFGKSQWMMPTKEHYQKLQSYCQQKGIDAFKKEYDELKKEYDELKKEYYATRAYFDNTHDKMTDVWEYSRVQGEERHGHATPKPVAMIERIIKSSCPENELTFEPFLGSGTTIIACEKTNRIAIGTEISPKYCDVILKRWENLTGKQATLARNIN